MHTGSWNEWLSTFEIGERRYVETTIDAFPRDMSTINTPPSRRPASMRDWRFAASLFTAVGAGKAGDIRYLICVERTE